MTRAGSAPGSRTAPAPLPRARTPEVLPCAASGHSGFRSAELNFRFVILERGPVHGLSLDLRRYPLADLVDEFGCTFQVLGGLLLALAESDLTVAVPAAGFLDDVKVGGDVDQVTEFVYALAEDDLDLGFLEGRCHLVLGDLDPGAVADPFYLGLVIVSAPDFNADDGDLYQITYN